MLLSLLVLGCSRDLPVPEGQRCAVDGDKRACTHDTLRLSPGSLSSREVHFQTPLGTPPPDGWPVVLLFQGSLYSAQRSWAADRDGAHGAWWQTALIEELLATGFAAVSYTHLTLPTTPYV